MNQIILDSFPFYNGFVFRRIDYLFTDTYRHYNSISVFPGEWTRIGLIATVNTLLVSLFFYWVKRRMKAPKDSINCFSAKSIMPSSSVIHFFMVLQVHVCSIKSPPFIAVPHPTPHTQIDTVDSSLLKVWGGHTTGVSWAQLSWVEESRVEAIRKFLYILLCIYVISIRLDWRRRLLQRRLWSLINKNIHSRHTIEKMLRSPMARFSINNEKKEGEKERNIHNNNERISIDEGNPSLTDQ